MFTVSLLAASCTKEVLVSREHDLDAEVTEIATKLDMSVLYCNINDAEDASLLDLQKVGEYLDKCYTKHAKLKVVTLVSPAEVNGVKFSTWLNAYATDKGLQALSVEDSNENNKNNGNDLCMGALVASDLTIESHEVAQGLVLSHAVLHFEVEGIHFVVTDLMEARNAVPADWEAQVQTMTDNKKADAIDYDPDNLAIRKAELEELIKRTMEFETAIGNRPYEKDKYWVWTIDMNAPSSVDMKYEKEFARMDCYDYDDTTEAFFTTVTDYFSVSEFLTASDPYFATNQVMVYNGLLDCFAERSVFAPSSVNSTDNHVYDRNNFLYISDSCWNMKEELTLDEEAVNELGTTHYPILVTLKSEE